MSGNQSPSGGGAPAAVTSGNRQAGNRRLIGYILAVDGLAVLMAAITVAACHGDRAIVEPGGWKTAWLMPILLLLSGIGELVVVPLRHDGETEHLALFEAAAVVDVLLLPGNLALLAALGGLVLAACVRRRPAAKAAFNIGMFALASAMMVIITRVTAGAPGVLTARVVFGVVAGSVTFTVTNLLCLSNVLYISGNVDRRQVIRSSVRLSALMAVGAAAVGTSSVLSLLHSPATLPFAALPAVALLYAYRAAADRADEQLRSGQLLQLAQVIAEREDVVRRFLVLIREAFRADLAAVTLLQPQLVLSVDARQHEVIEEPLPGRLVTGPSSSTPRLHGPAGDFGRVLEVPMVANGQALGHVVLAGTNGSSMLPRDLALVAPLANALAAAIDGARHLERLVEETAKLQAVITESTDGIVVLDGEGTVQLWNPAMTAMTGVSDTDSLGHRLLDLADWLNHDDVLPALTAGRSTITTRVTLRRIDGEDRYLRMAHSGLFDDDRLVRDVVLVHDLTREQRADRMKGDFIATVSHELRTPLTPITGYVQLLRTHGSKISPEKRDDCLAAIAERAAHLARLIDDLLLASRIEAVEAVDAAAQAPAFDVTMGEHDLLEQLASLETAFNTPRLTLMLPETHVIAHCDPLRVMQVAQNLVSNALKYSPEHEPVAVTVDADSSRITVTVTDRGHGISADELPKVFDKFHRVEDPMTMRTGGTGLGLFIARQLARAMGGDVTATSILGKGSTFTLSLRPVKTAPPTLPMQRQAPIALDAYERFS